MNRCNNSIPSDTETRTQQMFTIFFFIKNELFTKYNVTHTTINSSQQELIRCHGNLEAQTFNTTTSTLSWVTAAIAGTLWHQQGLERTKATPKKRGTHQRMWSNKIFTKQQRRKLQSGSLWLWMSVTKKVMGAFQKHEHASVTGVVVWELNSSWLGKITNPTQEISTWIIWRLTAAVWNQGRWAPPNVWTLLLVCPRGQCWDLNSWLATYIWWQRFVVLWDQFEERK